MTIKLITAFCIGLLLSLIVISATHAGDLNRGKKLFKKCKACHSIKAEKHKIGPSLFGVFERPAGTASGFKRYKGLKGADWIWEEKSLDEYLKDPKLFVKTRTNKRSSMILRLKKERDRRDIIVYLKSLR